MTASADERRARLQAATHEFLAYRGTNQTRELLCLLDALVAQYYADLATVKPDRLGYVQGALAQVLALRNLLCQDNPHLSPLV